MKTLISAIFLVCMMALSSFTTLVDSKRRAAEQLAQHVIVALQSNSFDAYSALLPTLEELHLLMDENRSVYGANLNDAKSEFSKKYAHTVIVSARTSFDVLIEKGKQEGIDWRTVKFQSAEVVQQHKDSSVLIITSISSGKEFKICIEKVLQINGQLKVSQFVKLV